MQFQNFNPCVENLKKAEYNIFMSFKEYLNLIINLIKDWRVIVTVIAVIFVINCVCKIVDYRKKPKKVKKSKLLTEKAPAPEAQTQPAEAEAKEGEAEKK